MHFGYCFRAICELRVITNDMAFAYFQGSPPRQTISAEQARYFKSRLDLWFSRLPDPLTATKIVLPAQLKIQYVNGNPVSCAIFHLRPQLHTLCILNAWQFCHRSDRFSMQQTLRLTLSSMEYHSMIIGISQAQNDEEFLDSEPLQHKSGPRSSNDHAKICLETVLRLYYLRHSFDIFDAMMIHFLTILGHLTLENVRSFMDVDDNADETLEGLRSTLVLCAHGLHQQGLNFILANLAYRMFRERIKSYDQALLKVYNLLSATAADEPLPPDSIQALWPMPIINYNEDPRKSSMETLIKEYGYNNQVPPADQRPEASLAN